MPFPPQLILVLLYLNWILAQKKNIKLLTKVYLDTDLDMGKNVKMREVA